jgi:WD40 repeat protein
MGCNESMIDARRKISDDGHKGWVNVITFSPDGKLLTSASRADNTVKLWGAVLGVGKKML